MSAVICDRCHRPVASFAATMVYHRGGAARVDAHCPRCFTPLGWMRFSFEPPYLLMPHVAMLDRLYAERN